MKLFITHKNLMKLLMFHVVIITPFFFFCQFLVFVHSSGKNVFVVLVVFMFSQRNLYLQFKGVSKLGHSVPALLDCLGLFLMAYS